MNNLLKHFWKWYEKHLTLNIAIATFLFALQLTHLYWLLTHVIWMKAFGYALFNPSPFFEWLLIVIDYTEIPALITTSLLYINEYRQKKNFKSLLYLAFLNIQLLHMFWITDEFVIEEFTGSSQTILPSWLAWIAILIDYLELPIIYDTTKKLIHALKMGDPKKIKEAFIEKD